MSFEVFDDQLPSSEREYQNQKKLKRLYKALSNGDTKRVAKVAGSNLEWWFHGPPHCHHMMKVLTGESTYQSFRFKPRKIRAIKDRVIIEGWEGSEVYWVHVWNLKDGIISQLREYFNASVCVINGVSGNGEELPLWESTKKVCLTRSLPGLVLPH